MRIAFSSVGSLTVVKGITPFLRLNVFHVFCLQEMSDATSLLTLLLCMVILMVPMMAFRFHSVNYSLSMSDRFRLKERLSAIRHLIYHTFKPFS